MFLGLMQPSLGPSLKDYLCPLGLSPSSILVLNLPLVIYIPILEYSVVVKKAQYMWCDYTEKDLLMKKGVQLLDVWYDLIFETKSTLLFKIFKKHVLLPFCVCIITVLCVYNLEGNWYKL